MAAGLLATNNSATAAGLTATIADSSAQTENPTNIFQVGNKLVYSGKIPATGNYSLGYLDGTSTIGLDFSSIPNFDSFDSLLGYTGGRIFFDIYDTNGDQVAYAYDGTNFTQITGMNPSSYDNSLWDGVEYNGAFYFNQTGPGNLGTVADGVNCLFKLSGNAVTPVNFGDDNNPLFVMNGEPKAVFNGKLYVDGYDSNVDADRFLVAMDSAGFTKVTGTIDYQGSPVLRAFPYIDSAIVFNNALYFSSTFETSDVSDASSYGDNFGSSLFKLDTAGTVTRLDASTTDVFSGGKDLPNRPENLTISGSNLYFKVPVMHTNASELYKVDGAKVTLVDTFQSLSLWDAQTFGGKFYFNSGGKYIGTLADANNQTRLRQLGTIDSAGNYAIVAADSNYNNYGSVKLFNNGLLYSKPDADPRTKDELWFNNGSTSTKIDGVQDVEFADSYVIGNKIYFVGVSPTDSNPGTNRLFMFEAASTPVTPPVDTDNPALTTLSEAKDFAGSVGSVAFADGSGFDIDAKGRLYSKIKSKFLVQTAGSFVVTYKVGTKNKTWTCKIANYGSLTKLKTAPAVAKLYKTKKACQLPKAAIAALKIGVVTFKQNLVVKRYYPTTAKAKTPAGLPVRPLTRKMTVRMGKLH
jgi:hypothetical protein